MVTGAGLDLDRLHRLLIEQGRGLICAHDGSGFLLYVNPAAADALGYRREELIGTELRRLLHPSVRRHFDAYLERIWVRGEDRGLMRLVTCDGRSQVWSYDNVRHRFPGLGPIVLGHARDVTADRWVERAARDRDARYRVFFNASREGYCRVGFERSLLIEDQHGRVLEEKVLDNLRSWGFVAECNDAFARFHGAASAREMQRTPLSRLGLFNEPKSLEGVRRLIANRFETTEFDGHEMDGNGHVRRFRVSALGTVGNGSLDSLCALLREADDEERPEARAEENLRLLAHLAERLLEARDDERRRIAGEIQAALAAGRLGTVPPDR